MLRKFLLPCFAFGLAILIVPGNAVATGFQIAFSVLFEGREPEYGAAHCKSGKRCRIVENAGLTLDLVSSPVSGQAELRISCSPADCSFANGRSATNFKNSGEFEVYQGVTGVNQLLVLTPRLKVGRVLLIPSQLPD